MSPEKLRSEKTPVWPEQARIVKRELEERGGEEDL
jgi:hypothetical protein